MKTLLFISILFSTLFIFSQEQKNDPVPQISGSRIQVENEDNSQLKVNKPEPALAATGTVDSSQVSTQNIDTIGKQNAIPELMNSNISGTQKQSKKQNSDNEPKLLNAEKKEEDF